jgi:7-cyano-7-deazaguanine synthase
MKKKAVCLISGGIDSCVTAYLAKNKNFLIYGLTVNYGQQHKKEMISARKIGELLGVENHIFIKIDFNIIGGSSLTDNSIKIENERNLDEIGSNIPSTYVPARNTILLSIALAYAESIEAEYIFIGVTSTDYSGYPDCRPEYIQAFQNMANLATKKAVEENPIKINTPLLYKTKSDIIKIGLKLDAPLECTWSCYKGGKKACGVCDSCLLRLKGFKESKTHDKIEYYKFPDWYKNKN